MSHPAINWVGWALAVLMLVPIARSWWYTRDLLGGIGTERIREMLYLASFTGQLPVLLAVPAVLALLVGLVVMGVAIPSGILAAMLSAALAPALRLALPPSVLFLAASSARARDLFLRLHLMAGPLRVVALLDPERMGPLGQMLRLDLMRTSSEKTWKSMVHRLMDTVPVFVVDTVGRTGPVRYEAFLVLAPERAGRTVFIADDHGDCPSLLAEGVDPAEHAIPVTHPDRMELAVGRLLDVERARPREERPASPRRVPVVQEDWDSLPSVLAIGLADGIDGEFLLAQARATDRDLIVLLLPFSSTDQETAELSIQLSWDFARAPRLAGIYFEEAGRVMVRREFLLQHPELLDFHVEQTPPGRLSMADLDRPAPVWAAVHELCGGWRDAARRDGLEFRFARK